MPFFSIIIPTYNRAYILPETLSHLQKQSYISWECVVVDDGSTDNTKEVMETLMLSESRLKYVYQKNAERGAARNNGAKNARGQYFIFLDSDDAFAPNYLSELQEFLEDRNLPKALIVSDFCTWDGKLPQQQKIPDLAKYNVAEWLFTYPVSPSRACVHVDIFKEFQFREDIVIVEDTVLWVSIATKFPLLHFRKPLVWYRVHEGNSVNPSNNSGLKRLAGLKLFFKDPLSSALSSSFKRKIISDTTFQIAQSYYLQNKTGKILIYLVRSLLCKPFHPQTKAKLLLLISLIPGFGRMKTKLSLK